MFETNVIRNISNKKNYNIQKKKIEKVNYRLICITKYIEEIEWKIIH